MLVLAIGLYQIVVECVKMFRKLADFRKTLEYFGTCRIVVGRGAKW